MDSHPPTFFGLTSFRNSKKKFGIKQDDRRRHFYTIGKTGMGKSNLMENMAIQDIQNGHGIGYVDPHGEGAEKLLDYIPEERINDVIFFNPADLDFPIAFNVMEKVDFRYRHLVAGGLMAVFKKVWPDVWSARMEYILSNTILALLEYPNSTLLGVNRMLSDPEFRALVVAEVKDPIVKAFWSVEFARYSQKYETEATAAIQNKVGQFVSNALIRNVIGQVESTVNMRQIMDGQKILILDLSKGRIGEDNSRLLGALLITKIQLAAMSRVDIPEKERKDFYLYVDEFQNFATESFASILSEARKYRLCLIVGHQYITQMDEIVRDAVFGNVGTMAVFRVGAEDAEFLEKEFSPEFTAEDLVNLTKYNIYLKLMIDGVASHPFSAQTLPPPPPLMPSYRQQIIEASRKTYGKPREVVEEAVAQWTLASQGKPAVGGANVITAPRPGASFTKTPVSSAPGGEGTVLYDAVCSTCGKDTKVIFEPTPGKPVYCKSCRKKMKPKDPNAPTRVTEVGASAPQQKPQPKPELKPVLVSPLPPVPPPVVEAPAPIKIESPVAVDLPVKIETSSVAPKIENIPFNKKDTQPHHSHPVRKPINLSELKKALDVSLEHAKAEKKEDEDDGEGWEEIPAEEVKPEELGRSGIIKPGQKIDI